MAVTALGVLMAQALEPLSLPAVRHPGLHGFGNAYCRGVFAGPPI